MGRPERGLDHLLHPAGGVIRFTFSAQSFTVTYPIVDDLDDDHVCFTLRPLRLSPVPARRAGSTPNGGRP